MGMQGFAGIKGTAWEACGGGLRCGSLGGGWRCLLARSFAGCAASCC